MNRLTEFLASPTAPIFIILLAVVFTSPSLLVGYFGDDYLHHALLSPGMPFPKPDDGSLFGLFSFINGDPARNQILRDFSLLSWWSYDGLKFVFWRPVTELTHWLDHRLWHHSPELMHIHNLLWYAALCMVVGMSYRRLSSSALAAGVALFAFALDSSHGFGVGWISSRNAIIAATFGVCSLLAYRRWREEGHRLSQGLSLLCLVLSLLSAEAGISSAAFLGAYALILDKKGPWRGLLALWAHVALTLGWWLLYKHLGFGAANADAYYIDPVQSPGLFILKVLERLPVMLASQFGIIPAEVYGFAGKPVPAYIGLCLLFIAGVLYLMRNVLRQHATSRFWLTASLFALLPVASALPHDRNLLFVSIGGAMLIGELLQDWSKRATPTTLRQRLGSGITVSFLSLHLIAAPLLMPFMAYSPRIWTNHMQLEAIHLPEIEQLSQKSLLLIGAPLPAALGMTAMRYTEELPLPARLWTLTTQQIPIELTRPAANELRVIAKDGFVTGTEKALRDTERFPFKPGDTVKHSGMTLEVVRVNERAEPVELRLEFDPHHMDNLVALQWQHDHYEVAELPQVGSMLAVTWPAPH